MNPPQGMESPPSRGPGPFEPPADWRQAIAGLVTARIAIFEAEARVASRQAARRGALSGAAAAALFFTWALLVTAAIGGLVSITGWGWHWPALIAALLHAAAAALLFRAARAAGSPAFPITRSEFQKDREWLESFQNPKKS